MLEFHAENFNDDLSSDFNGHQKVLTEILEECNEQFRANGTSKTEERPKNEKNKSEQL